MVTSDSFPRPDSLADDHDPAVLYARSYLLIRFVVGAIGLALPLGMILLEAWVLDGDVMVRGSLSAYYHSGARDLFVGALSVVGVLLVTYLAAQPNTWDFRLSLLAGIAVLGVAFVPTARPGIPEGAPLCGTTPIPNGCTAIPQQLGETAAATLHYVSAAIFILALAVLCFVFARRERDHADNPRLARVLQGCGWAIVAAIGWILLGLVVDLTIWRLRPLWVGEVVAVWAFGTAWLLKSRDGWGDLLDRLRRAG